MTPDLKPGDLFTVEGEGNRIFEVIDVCTSEITDTPGVKYVRAWEMEGPRGALRRRQFRAIWLHRVLDTVDGRVAA